MRKLLLLVCVLSGVVNAPGGRVTVFPANVLAISIDLEMTITTEDARGSGS